MHPVALTAESPPGLRRRDLAPAVAVAAGVVVLRVLLSGRYGFHRDELVALAAGRHPAAGYPDQAPGIPLATRALSAAIGVHLWPLRVLAGLAHGAVVMATAALAATVGGRRQTIGLAALVAALAPLFLAQGSLFLPPVFDLLWWALAILVVARLLAGADPRWWLAVGALVGVGLETRGTMLLLAAGLAVGLVAVPEGRAQLRSPWLWAGAGVALALWLPNLAWEAGHGWPVADVAAGVRDHVRADGGPLDVARRQIVLAGPAALGLAALGTAVLARRPWRPLLVAAGVVVVLVLATGGRATYLGPLYVPLVAAGAVLADRWIGVDPTRWHQVVTVVVVAGLIALPAVTPLLPPADYGSLVHDIDGQVGEEVGWPEMVHLVGTVRRVLPDEEQDGLMVVTAGSGEAAAIDLYGPAEGMPRGTALSAAAGARDRWPDGQPAGTVIFVRFPRRVVEQFCDSLGPVAAVGNDARVPNRAYLADIAVCRTLRVTPGELRAGLARWSDPEM
jgi:Dolichyl-phosphate-mannose-protein mannosyltransferase